MIDRSGIDLNGMKTKVAIITVVYLALSAALGFFLNSSEHPFIELAVGPLRGFGNVLREISRWSDYPGGFATIDTSGLLWISVHSAICIAGLVLINLTFVRRRNGTLAALVLLWMGSSLLNIILSALHGL